MRNTIMTMLWAGTLMTLCLCTTQAKVDPFAKSGRNSISYINLLVKSNPKFDISPTNQSYYLKEIEGAVKMPRFDLNILPEKYVAQFKSEASSRNLTLEQMDELLTATIVPHLLKVLDYYKIARALPEVEREQFIVAKAKEDGITAEDLARVMNSAYIYMPFVDRYTVTREKDKDGQVIKGGKIKVALSGGVAWYHMVYENDQPVVRFEGRDVGKFSSSAAPKDTLDNKQRVSPLDYAFRKASRALCKDLQVRVKERFPVSVPIEGIDGGTILVRLGKREGIGLDDKFRIVEYFENEDGELEQSGVGHVFVTQVGDNREKSLSMSRCKKVIGGFETGMVAIEHPRFGVDLVIGIAWLPLRIDSMIVMNGSTEYLLLENEHTGGAYVGQAALQYNLAKATGISQLFLNLQGSFGVADIKGTLLGEDLPLARVFGYSAGLSKKFYLSRLVVKFEGAGLWQRISMNKTIDGVKYEYLIDNFGARIGGGIEFVLGIDLNVGLAGYYHYMENNSFVDMKVDGQIPQWWSDIPYGDKITFNQEGFEGRFYVAYSLPSLGL